jgi:large subunit ribosomal protein L20
MRAIRVGLLGFSTPNFKSNPHEQENRTMSRVKRGTKRRARRKKLLKHAKGFFLTKGKLYRSAREAVNRSLRFSYRDRRNRKRDFRTLWIQRIGAAVRNNGLSYSQFIHGLKIGGIDLDRKIMADMAVNDAAGFTALVETAKSHLPVPRAKK